MPDPNQHKRATCETCDDDGYVDIVDDSGGVIGPAPCPNCSPDDPLEAVDRALDTWGEERDVFCVVCPICAFTFDSAHHDADGGYSCPACAEAALTLANECLGKDLVALERTLELIDQEHSQCIVIGCPTCALLAKELA